MKTLTAEDVRSLLRRECEDAGGQKAWATENGLSAAYVNDVLRDRRAPGDSIAEILGLSKVVGWRKKELDEYGR